MPRFLLREVSLCYVSVKTLQFNVSAFGVTVVREHKEGPSVPLALASP